MSKPEAGSAEALNKSMKSKGRQKTKFWCQMCQKQCKDQNGFNCHLVSETHKRQMELFTENPQKYINQYSNSLEDNFLDILKRKYKNKKVRANKVYVDYMADRMHVHLNSTKWTSLGAFVDHLKKTGKVEVEKDEEDQIYITYIERNAETVAKKAKEEQTLKAELKEYERMQKHMMDMKEKADQLVAAEQEKMKNEETAAAEEKKEGTTEETSAPLSIGFEFKKPTNNAHKPAVNLNRLVVQKPTVITEIKSPFETSNLDKRKKVSQLDMLSEQIRTKGQKTDEAITRVTEDESREWISVGMFVTIKDPNLKDFLNKQGVIESIAEPFLARIKPIDSKSDTVNVDQFYLEPVPPRVGQEGLVLTDSEFMGKRGIVESIDAVTKSAAIFFEGEAKSHQIPLKSLCRYRRPKA